MLPDTVTQGEFSGKTKTRRTGLNLEPGFPTWATSIPSATYLAGGGSAQCLVKVDHPPLSPLPPHLTHIFGGVGVTFLTRKEVGTTNYLHCTKLPAAGCTSALLRQQVRQHPEKVCVGVGEGVRGTGMGGRDRGVGGGRCLWNCWIRSSLHSLPFPLVSLLLPPCKIQIYFTRLKMPPGPPFL